MTGMNDQCDRESSSRDLGNVAPIKRYGNTLELKSLLKTNVIPTIAIQLNRLIVRCGNRDRGDDPKLFISNHQSASRQDGTHNLTRRIRQPLVATIPRKRQSRVIEPHEMQDCCVQIVNVDPINFGS